MTMQGVGWYAAPDGQPYQRWWDGHQWTARTQPYGPPVRSGPSAGWQVFHGVMTVCTLGMWLPLLAAYRWGKKLTGGR